jgi:hypothetical protein
LLVLLGVAVVGFGISLFRTPLSPQEFLEALLRSAGQLLTGSIAAFGNIVLIFAILERTLPASELEEKPEAWDPAELAREPDPDQVKRGELVFEIVFTIIALVVFNLYPELIGIPFVVDGQWTIIPILSDAFSVYLPWLNLLWLLGVVLDVVLLRQEVWTTATRLSKIGLALAEIALAFVMLTGPALVQVSTTALAGIPLGDAAELFASMLNLIPLLVLGILIIANTIEVIQLTLKLFRRGPAPAMPAAK